MSSVMISQPRYLPTLNYLQRLNVSDFFIVLDNVQRQHRGFENRNIILVDGGKKWLTIPIVSSHRSLIKDSVIKDVDWVGSHKDCIKSAYSNHPFFDEFFVDEYFKGVMGNDFVDVVLSLLFNVCELFDINLNIIRASNCSVEDVSGVDNLLELCRSVDACSYISGFNGLNYGVDECFSGSGVAVLYHKFVFPVYKQFGSSSFVGWVCFFDQLFNVGFEQTKKWVKGVEFKDDIIEKS